MSLNLQTQELLALTPLADHKTYWVYSQPWSGNRYSGGGRIFQISIVTSPHIKVFNRSKLRLIIVNEPIDETDDLSTIDSEAHPEVEIRLIQDYEDRPKDIIPAQWKPTEECITLALGFNSFEDDGVSYGELRPLPLSNSQKRFRILYDRVHSFNSSGSLPLLTLECNVKIPADVYGILTGVPVGEATVYYFHISPAILTSGRAVAHSLPNDIIIRIGLEVVECRNCGYRRQIFQLGTIARSWTPILELYFLLHADFNSDQPSELRRDREASIISVARSLQYRPERAQLMKGFSLDFYVEHNYWRDLSESERFDALKAANEILQHLAYSQIDRIDIHPVPQPLYHDYVSALSKLNHLRLITEQKPGWPAHYNDAIPSYNISVLDLHILVNKWPHLEKLTIKLMEGEPDLWSADDESGTRPLACNPRQLTISVGYGPKDSEISGSNFHRFFKTTAPRIQELILRFVLGPNNMDLYLALLQIRETLYYLTIDNSTFPKSNDDEEYALDQLMHQLINIKTIGISHSNCISSKSIARKGPDTGDTKSRLIVGTKEPSMTVGILGALKEGGWKYISINQSQSENFSENEEAIQIALGRGIQFSWRAFM